LALLAQIAAASPTPDLSGYLAVPPGSDWIESGQTSYALVGVITTQSYGAWANDNGASERALRRGGFVTGYGRAWEQRVTRDYLGEFVLAFNSALGATHWYNDLKLFDQTSTHYTKDIPAISTRQSVGVEWTFPDGSHEYAIEFAKGNLVFDVTMDSDSTDLAATTLALAQTEFDKVPESGEISFTSNKVSQLPAGWIIGFALVALVVFVAIGVFALVSFGRQKTGVFAYAAGPQMSADGAYWWDGSAWRDANLHAPPGARRSPDGLFWWDGRMWRRSGPA
jgi:hypothetical protein